MSLDKVIWTLIIVLLFAGISKIMMKAGRRERIYIVIICILSFYLLFVGVLTMLVLHLEHSTYEWCRKSINEGEYLIVGKTEVGSILIPIGSQDVKIDIFDEKNKKLLVSFETEIDNGGGKLTKDNYEVESNEEYIKIKLINREGEAKETYRFFFEDFY